MYIILNVQVYFTFHSVSRTAAFLSDECGWIRRSSTLTSRMRCYTLTFLIFYYALHLNNSNIETFKCKIKKCKKMNSINIMKQCQRRVTKYNRRKTQSFWGITLYNSIPAYNIMSSSSLFTCEITHDLTTQLGIFVYKMRKVWFGS